jgi:opine dehydrogenase
MDVWRTSHPARGTIVEAYLRSRGLTMIPMSAMGGAVGVRTPAIDALVELARSMTGKDFAAEARTLERLGLSGMDAPQIRRVVEEGFS